MCVIIFVPENKTISKSELQNAWDTNPHGAGFSIQNNNKVEFKRGFMEFEDFYNNIKDYIGNKNLLLHFRISTSNKVNKVQTHPYKKGDVTLTEGCTSRPVICMNGIISGQKEYKNCNDTMSYIIDHQSAFANVNQDILNIIEKATGAKWAVMKPDEVLLSSKFTNEKGIYYSNTNHFWRKYYYTSYNKTKRSKKTFRKMIKEHWLRNNIKKDNELYLDILDFIEFWCNNNACNYCTKCLKYAKNINDIYDVLNENYYGEEYYYDGYDCESCDLEKNGFEEKYNKNDYDDYLCIDTDGCLVNLFNDYYAYDD